MKSNKSIAIALDCVRHVLFSPYSLHKVITFFFLLCYYSIHEFDKFNQ
jgi:hypothetical protein